MHSAATSRSPQSRSNVMAVIASTALTVASCAYNPESNAPVLPDADSITFFDSVEAFERMSGADWEAALTPLFNRARDSVQRETGTDLSNVNFAVVSNQIIEVEVAAETGRLTHSQFTDKSFAKHFLTNVMAGQAGTYAALYSTETEQVMVSSSLLSSYIKSVGNDAQAIKHALTALLIHELVHAADDSAYGIHRNRNLNFRASFAQSAVYEGHAQYLTRRICQRSGCLAGLGSLDRFMFGEKLTPNQLTQPVQAVSRNVLEYSYIEGERFVSSLAKRTNGQQLIESALRTPPVDPIQILDPSSFPNQNRQALNQQLLQASGTISHEWNTQPWIRVETSPLKGVNLRSDPTRRAAAIDGFTRLIQGMVAFQHYDQSAVDASPIEVTLMSAETNQTAELFGQSLASNLVYTSGSNASEQVVWLNESVPVSVITVATVLDDGRSHTALVASNEAFVLQLVGVDIAQQKALDYVASVLTNLVNSGSGT